MADGNQENQWRRDLQQVQNTSTKSTPTEGEVEDEEEEYLPMQPEPLARDIDEDIIKENSKSPQSEAARMRQEFTEKIRSKTSGLLRMSWLNAVWPSFGTSLIYVAFHYVMAYVAHSKYFPRAGREWVKFTTDKLPQPRKVKKFSEETYGQVMEAPELFTFCCCCTSCIAPFFVLFLVIYMLANPCETLGAISSTLRSIAGSVGICD